MPPLGKNRLSSNRAVSSQPPLAELKKGKGKVGSAKKWRWNVKGIETIKKLRLLLGNWASGITLSKIKVVPAGSEMSPGTGDVEGDIYGSQ